LAISSEIKDLLLRAAVLRSTTCVWCFAIPCKVGHPEGLRFSDCNLCVEDYHCTALVHWQERKIGITQQYLVNLLFRLGLVISGSLTTFQDPDGLLPDCLCTLLRQRTNCCLNSITFVLSGKHRWSYSLVVSLIGLTTWSHIVTICCVHNSLSVDR
jgi:hypothetical protein